MLKMMRRGAQVATMVAMRTVIMRQEWMLRLYVDRKVFPNADANGKRERGVDEVKGKKVFGRSRECVRREEAVCVKGGK
jgi:hypothetical protein